MGGDTDLGEVAVRLVVGSLHHGDSLLLGEAVVEDLAGRRHQNPRAEARSRLRRQK